MAQSVLTMRFNGTAKNAPVAGELEELLTRARGSVMWNLAHVESRLKPAERPYSQMSRELKELLAEINRALGETES